jgi:hypothetical protein
LSDARSPPLLEVLRRPDELPVLGLPQWEALIVQARRANLISRIAHRLGERNLLEGVPRAPRAHLEAALILAAAQAEAVRREVTYIRRALARVGIDIVLLKGAAYLMAGLPAAGGRMFTDIDILVPFERLAEVELALRLKGWVTTHHGAYDQRYYRQWMHELPPMRHGIRMTVVDVHHAILPRTARLKPSSAKLLAASRPIAGEDRLRVLAPADMVLHSAAHLFCNEDLSHGLRDLGDLDCLLRHFGGQPGFWDELPRRAVDLDLARPLYYALRYASTVLGTPVPGATMTAAEADAPPQPLRGLMDFLYLRALRPNHATCADAWTPLARWMLFVRAHWLRMPLPLLIYHLTHKALVREKSGENRERPRNGGAGRAGT